MIGKSGKVYRASALGGFASRTAASLCLAAGFAFGVGPAAAQQGAETTELDQISVEGRGAGGDATGPVGGYAAKRTATGSKTDTPLIEIPQTVNVIPAEQIAAQGATSVSQALRYTAGVAAEQYGASSKFDTYTQIRGFKADFFLDGLALPDGDASTDWATSAIEPYGLERVEVLKGPSSVLYGQSGPGGLVNMVSKRPTAEPYREIQVQTGSFDRLQGAFDLSGPIDEEGRFLYRLTGLARDSDTQVEFIKDNRQFIAPAFTWKPSEDTTLTLLGQYLRERGGQTGFNYLPTDGTLRSVPGYGKLPFSRYSGDPDFDRFDRDQGSIGYAFDHRFNETLSFHQNVRYTENDIYLRALNRAGELILASGKEPTLMRRAFRIDAGAKTFTADNRAEAKFETGAFAHTMLFGLDYRHDKSRYDTGAFFGAPPITIFDPVYGLPIVDPGINFEKKDALLKQTGVYAQDQIKFGDGWIATLAGRHDWADIDTRTDDIMFGSGVTKQHNEDRAFSGRAGLSYVFASGLAPYVSVSTSFQPTAETAEDGDLFKPLTSKQYEAGVKFQPNGMNALVTASVFHIEQKNFATADRTNPLFNEQLGEVRVRGFEAEARGKLDLGVGLIASYAYLDHEITKSTVSADIGNRLPSVPVHQASLWADYVIQSGALEGLGAGLGVRYVGRTTNVANDVRVPSYTLFDAAVTYDLGKASTRLAGAELRINAKNLANKYYVSQCGNVPGCTLGSHRTVLATMSYKW